MTEKSAAKILVTGATGYIGGRLVPYLLEAGYWVRVLVRDPQRLQGRSWIDEVDVVSGDVLDPNSLGPALEGITAAFYLIHSMAGGADFHERDLAAAHNFGNAAKIAGLEQIIYLGGLGDFEADLSEHLKSRQETGRALSEAGVPVTEFRAAVIVGSGSISFEMIRYLTERIPVMICPRWVFTRTQPIGIGDVLNYLEKAIKNPGTLGKIIQIGGEDVITYGEMMMGYAEERKLKRAMVPVPFLTPKLSAYWVHWMTPVPAEIAHALVEGLRNEAIVTDDSAKEIFPDIQPLDYQKSVQAALAGLISGDVESRWTDSLVSSSGAKDAVLFSMKEGMIMERRQIRIDANPGQVFEVIKTLGGEKGWLFFNWAWQARGLIDRLLGGVGLRRGRRDPVDLRVGDAVDFWRVEYIDPDCCLRLRSEMITPGPAWLQYDLEEEQGYTLLKQSAYFVPTGLAGLLYWYVLYPFHSVIFSGLIRGIRKEVL